MGTLTTDAPSSSWESVICFVVAVVADWSTAKLKYYRMIMETHVLLHFILTVYANSYLPNLSIMIKNERGNRSYAKCMRSQIC